MTLADLAASKPAAPRILTLDIETSPIIADVWGLWDQRVGINQIREASRVMCFAAKWHGQKRVMFHSEHHDGRDAMVTAAWNLLNQADIVVGYNHRAFDIKHLQREFVLAGMAPTTPWRDVDLLTVARSRFKFPSNKLDYVSQALGIGSKVKHEGHGLWRACLEGDPKAWARMKRYNVGDVRLTEELFDRLRPWVKGINWGLYVGDEARCCPNCGHDVLEPAGHAATGVTRYPAYRCASCGAVSRGKNRSAAVPLRGVTS